MPERRFPLPWSVEEQPACFVVRDYSGQALAYVYTRMSWGRRIDYLCDTGHTPTGRSPGNLIPVICSG